jgi:hypothetical protein
VGFFLGFLISDQVTLFYLGTGIFVPCVVISLCSANEKYFMGQLHAVEISEEEQLPQHNTIQVELQEEKKNSKSKLVSVCELLHEFRLAFWVLVIQQYIAW